MKTTAKMSLIIALALCITIGGVYATWIYGKTTLKPVVGSSDNVGITLESAVVDDTDIDAGTIVIDATPSVSIDDGGSHIGTLKWTADDDFKFHFETAGETAGSAVGSEASPTQINVKCTITLTANEASYTNEVLKLVVAEGWTLDSTGTGFYELTKTFANVDAGVVTVNLADLIQFHTVPNLPTQEDYNDFAAKLAALSLEITITLSHVA